MRREPRPVRNAFVIMVRAPSAPHSLRAGDGPTPLKDAVEGSAFASYCYAGCAVCYMLCFVRACLSVALCLHRSVGMHPRCGLDRVVLSFFPPLPSCLPAKTHAKQDLPGAERDTVKLYSEYLVHVPYESVLSAVC